MVIYVLTIDIDGVVVIAFMIYKTTSDHVDIKVVFNMILLEDSMNVCINFVVVVTN